MIILRLDPWQSEYGASVEVEEPDAEPESVDPTVESADWARGIAPREPGGSPQLYFVDGVRRVDLRVRAEQPDGGAAFGLFGSYAVGAVACFGKAEFADARMARNIVVGSGLEPQAVALSVGTHTLRYDPLPAPGTEFLDPLLKLQGRMRERESSLAAELAERGHAPVLTDGPLSVFTRTASPVIGYIKRQVRVYLAPEQQGLLARLGPGERTPIFALSQATADRFAWYLRLAPRRPVEHPWSGIVRCEVLVTLGLPEARRLADLTGAVLPGFASAPGHDPRAPQNLYPVGALEAHLRRHLGHAEVVRRALTAHLASQITA